MKSSFLTIPKCLIARNLSLVAWVLMLLFLTSSVHSFSGIAHAESYEIVSEPVGVKKDHDFRGKVVWKTPGIDSVKFQPKKYITTEGSVSFIEIFGNPDVYPAIKAKKPDAKAKLTMTKGCYWMKIPFQIAEPADLTLTVRPEDQVLLAGDPEGKDDWAIDNFLYFEVIKPQPHNRPPKTDRFVCGTRYDCKIMYWENGVKIIEKRTPKGVRFVHYDEEGQQGEEVRNVCQEKHTYSPTDFWVGKKGAVDLSNLLYNDGRETHVKIYPMDFGGKLYVSSLYLVIK